MIKTTIAALVAATALTTVANAGTYRIDFTPAEGVKFAPWGSVTAAVEADQDVMASDKIQAIDGKPANPVAGMHGNTWVIVEAEQGDELIFRAMNGMSLDVLGQVTIEVPSDTPESHSIVGTRPGVLDVVHQPFVDAERVAAFDIMGFDAGADEGTDKYTALESPIGAATIRELSK